MHLKFTRPQFQCAVLPKFSRHPYLLADFVSNMLTLMLGLVHGCHFARRCGQHSPSPSHKRPWVSAQQCLRTWAAKNLTWESFRNSCACDACLYDMNPAYAHIGKNSIKISISTLAFPTPCEVDMSISIDIVFRRLRNKPQGNLKAIDVSKLNLVCNPTKPSHPMMRCRDSSWPVVTGLGSFLFSPFLLAQGRIQQAPPRFKEALGKVSKISSEQLTDSWTDDLRQPFVIRHWKHIASNNLRWARRRL